MNKKIFIIGPFYPLRGGIADFNHSLCKALIDLGYDCQAISFSLQYPKWLFPGKTQYDPDKRETEFPVSFLINSINPISWHKTVRFIKNHNPIALITAYWIPFIGISTACILKKIKKPVKRIALAHNIIPHQKMPADKLITRFFINQNDEFIVLSEQVAKDLKAFKPNAKYIVSPHPIYDIFGEAVDRPTALKKLNLSDGNYLLFFGLIKKYKGLDLLLQAFAYPDLKNLDVKLLIAGEFYEKKQKYIELIHSLKIEDKVILHDYFIPKDKVKYYFSVADAVVQPYRSATQSGVAAVAYQFFKPMIVSNVGGLKEIVQDGKTGFIIPEYSPEALAKTILRFYQMKDKIEFEKFIADKRKELSWENFAKKILTLIETNY